ncbi:hypothetical protein Pcinc_012381 [Petrolisthes cinctipes]|uniref:Uncharacterized protein n=1 Tax=Petrolisthes cinctipes TaxID=88211 RepID=A0AAE1KVH5_PETCI|nr:hypothetical protein Pcinc_012381 [Petrolisthes cinctipes]
MPQPNTPHSGLRDVNSLGSTLPPRSLFTSATTISSMPATTHCLIARRELPGYHPQKWCAVCGKTTSKNTAYVSCEEKDCPNLCHTSCLGDFPVHREVFASALRISDRLIASKQHESIVTTKNQPVSALASTIDKHWESVCQGSEYWRRWWSSGRPQHLRHTIRSSPPLGIIPTTTAATGTDTTPTITSITTAATGTDTTPPVIPTITAAIGTDTTPTSPVTIPTVTNNTTTAQSDTEETNPNSAGPATSPHPPPVASSTPTTRKRGRERREKGKTRNPSQQQQGSKSRYWQREDTQTPPSPLQHLFSQFCHNLNHPFHNLTPGDRTRVCSGSLHTSILTLPPHTNDTTP